MGLGVGSQLAYRLPHPWSRPSRPGRNQRNVISATPYGSASVLISGCTLRMGPDGVTDASRGNRSYPLYCQPPQRSLRRLICREKGHLAHECIIDIRPLKERTGVTEEDVASDLSIMGSTRPPCPFPSLGTNDRTDRIRSLAENRFCDAMLSIRGEIKAVEEESLANQQPLKNAPHTLDEITADQWDRPYSREQLYGP